jgi:uncharacterized membrane protein YvbJ
MMMETLDSENWQVVVDANNHPTESGNQILVQNKQDGNCYWMPKTTEILELFGIDNCNNHEEVMNDIPDTNECNNKQWNKNARLMLLNLYKKYTKYFASTTTNNDKV